MRDPNDPSQPLTGGAVLRGRSPIVAAAMCVLAALPACQSSDTPDGDLSCGNGRLEDGEDCDDGNLADGDWCRADCTIAVLDPPAYVKASNPGYLDLFGSVALSADGSTLAVGAVNEDSAATGVDGNQSSDTATDAGAVYVFVRSGHVWVQEAYLKAPNPEAYDQLGVSVALSGDGLTLAVGAWNEDGGAPGIGGDQADNSVGGAGAVYVYR